MKGYTNPSRPKVKATKIPTPGSGGGANMLTKTKGTVQMGKTGGGDAPSRGSAKGRNMIKSGGKANISQGGEKTKLGLSRVNTGRQRL